ncbi:MAG: hypothetical protein LBV18_03770 [Alistipes sp.]|jgi:alkanesulfonate monooxygenase SsuD/methylene tetrahydromethanopterin reductase-like flavin-dependent oxidoreductase (luciferase family)|nr:hypothetical protein [Alistipes sp.]
MKKAILFFVFVLAASGAGAQGIARMRSSLATAGQSGQRVEVNETASAAAAIAAADRNGRTTRVMTYSVSLFRDNSQSAGANARAVATKFKAMYADIPVEVSYESPYFKVTAGSFIDRIGAIALCGRILAEFPKAVVIQQDVPVGRIL